MTTLASGTTGASTPATHPIAPSVGAARSRALGLRLGPVEVAVLAMVVVAFAAVYFRWMLRQFGVGGWSFVHTEDWGHAYIVPLVSGFYLWKNRKTIDWSRAQVFWPGVGVILLGVVTYVFFVAAYSNHMFQGVAMLLSLGGVLLLLFGPALFPKFVFPLSYLGFAVTISEMVMLKITWGLKLLASKGAWAALNLMGVDTDLEGNILKVHHGNEIHPLNVADACSGMRMVIAFIALAVAVAFLSCRLWWQRVAILLLAIPVALLMNVARVAALGIATLYDPELASGGAHMAIGTVLLVPAFAVFMGCVWGLKQLAPDEGAAAATPAVTSKAAAAPSIGRAS